MVVELVVLGGLWWLTRDERSSPTTDENGGSPDAPTPLPVEGDDYRVSKVGEGDQNNIYELEARSGVMYSDGSGGYSWSSAGFLRGDFPTGFVRGSAGGISFEINETYYENVIQYPTKEAAIEADKVEEPSPDDPVKPEEPKEEEPELPPFQPPTGLPRSGFDSYNPFGRY